MSDGDNEYDLGEDIDWSAMERLANGENDEPFISGTPQVITTQMLRKQTLWDVAPHNAVERISEYLGLPSVSREGLMSEHQEAHDRSAAISVILQPISMIAEEVARAIVGTMMVTNGVSEISPVDGEEFTDTVEKLEGMLTNSSASIIATLLDWGLLHTPMFVTQEEYDELVDQEEGDEA